MNKKDFIDVISKKFKNVLFVNIEKIEPMLDVYVEDGSIEKYEWEYDEKKKTLNVDFFFSDGTKCNISTAGEK